MTVTVRDMVEPDLALVAHWLAQPHVLRWWSEPLSPAQVRARYLPRLGGADQTFMLTVVDDDREIGLAQWYRWDDYPDARDNYRIAHGELGIDYLIGELDACNRGLGTAMIGAVLDLLRTSVAPHAAVSVTPEAANRPSRRVLESSGFSLVEVFQAETLPGHPAEGPTARYRREL